MDLQSAMGTVTREGVDLEIARRDAILTAVTRVAEILLEGAGSWRDLIDEALAVLAPAAGAERAAVIEALESADGQSAIRRQHAWAVPGVDPLVDDPRLSELAYEQAGFGRTATALAAGELVGLRTADLEGSARQLLEEFGTRSVLFAPIHVDGTWWGAINLESVTEERAWSDVEREAMRLAARVVAASITRDRAMQVLHQHARELERSNAELEQFAYVASHDLQEPLRMVASFVQLLARKYEGQLDERAQDYIGFATDGAARMQQLINDLLAFSRVGTRARELEATDVAAVADEALHDLRTAIADHEATVEVGELPVVMGDPGQLRQVLQNLVGNGLKFRGVDPPEVRITAEPDGDAWRISVHDNGIGIAPEHAERVFAIFQRLHARDEYPGTGMGLAICRKIVERHGGRIWVDTEVREGTTVHFTVPATEAAR